MIRITGGEFRGRMIHAPTDERTRPTNNKIRQALFNSLQNYITDAKVLDLFAGTGALGLEALSRGADSVCFVEKSEQMVKLIKKNIETLGVSDQCTVLHLDVLKAWNEVKKNAPFHIILADPPYEGDFETPLLEEAPWPEILDNPGYFCLEWGRQKSTVKELPQDLPFLVKVREKNYGDSNLTTYARKGLDQDGKQGDLSGIV
jgi:16S rRNA (guanine966-N2)-methyltransferase